MTYIQTLLVITYLAIIAFLLLREVYRYVLIRYTWKLVKLERNRPYSTAYFTDRAGRSREAAYCGGEWGFIDEKPCTKGQSLALESFRVF